MPNKTNDYGDLIDEGQDGFGPPTEDRIPQDAPNDAPATTALAAYSDQPVFDRDEIVLPRLRIAQGLTAEVQSGDAHPGQILLSGFEPLDSATIVPLKFARMRELRGEGEERNTVLCTSNDAVTGVGDPGGQCTDCPLSQWSSKTARGKEVRVPPKCTFIFSYMVYVVEHQQIAVLEFRRTSEPVGRLLNTLVAQRGLRRFGVKLASDIKREGSRTYAVPTISPTQVPADVIAAASRSI